MVTDKGVLALLAFASGWNHIMERCSGVNLSLMRTTLCCLQPSCACRNLPGYPGLIYQPLRKDTPRRNDPDRLFDHRCDELDRPRPEDSPFFCCRCVTCKEVSVVWAGTDRAVLGQARSHAQQLVPCDAQLFRHTSGLVAARCKGG